MEFHSIGKEKSELVDSLQNLEQLLGPLCASFHVSNVREDLREAEVRRIAASNQEEINVALNRILSAKKAEASFLKDYPSMDRPQGLCLGVKISTPEELLLTARKADKSFRKYLHEVVSGSKLPFERLISSIKDISGIKRKIEQQNENNKEAVHNKSEEKSEQKNEVEEETERSAAKQNASTVRIFDINRATILFEEQAELDAILRELRRYFNIVSQLNKFATQWDGACEPPCLHLNLTFKDLPSDLAKLLEADGVWVMELQLTMKEFLDVKKRCHPVYQIRRQVGLPRACPVCGLFRKFVTFAELEKNLSACVQAGSSAGIRRGNWDGLPIAYKIIAGDEFEVKQADSEKFLQEVRYLTRLDSPLVVKICGVVKEAAHLGILTEWVHDGHLAKHLPNLSLKQKFEVAIQICDALIYLHMNAVVHQDLKCENILCKLGKDMPLIRLCDFGLSKDLKSISKHHHHAGSARFMSPEAWGEPNSGCKSATDVYSFGCVLIEIFAGKDGKYLQPWHEYGEKEIESRVRARIRPPELSELSKRLQQIAKDCLEFRPLERPSMMKVKKQLEKAGRKELGLPKTHSFTTTSGLPLTLKLKMNFETLSPLQPNAITIHLFVGAKRHLLDILAPYKISWTRNFIPFTSSNFSLSLGGILSCGFYKAVVRYGKNFSEEISSDTLCVKPHPLDWITHDLIQSAEESIYFRLMDRVKPDAPFCVSIVSDIANILTFYQCPNCTDANDTLIPTAEIYFPDDYDLATELHIMQFRQFSTAMVYVFGKLVAGEGDSECEVSAIDVALDLHYAALQKIDHFSKATKLLIFQKLSAFITQAPTDDIALDAEIKRLLAEAEIVRQSRLKWGRLREDDEKTSPPSVITEDMVWSSNPGILKQDHGLALTASHIESDDFFGATFMREGSVGSMGVSAGLMAGAGVVESVIRNVHKCITVEDVTKMECVMHIGKESVAAVTVGGAAVGCAYGLMQVGLVAAALTPVTAVISWAISSIVYCCLSNKPWKEKLARCGIQGVGTGVAVGGAVALVATGIAGGWVVLVLGLVGWLAGYGVMKILDRAADSWFYNSVEEIKEATLACKVLGLRFPSDGRVLTSARVAARSKILQILVHPDKGNKNQESACWVAQFKMAKEKLGKYLDRYAK